MKDTKKDARILRVADCRQKAILPPEGGRIALSANERIAEFLDFAIQAKFAYVNKLRDFIKIHLTNVTTRNKIVTYLK